MNHGINPAQPLLKTKSPRKQKGRPLERPFRINIAQDIKVPGGTLWVIGIAFAATNPNCKCFCLPAFQYR